MSSFTPSPFSTGYRPEADTLLILESDDASYFQLLIGKLRWIVELGQIVVTCKVSMMASMMAMPRNGQLEKLYHIFSYPKGNHNSEIVFDPIVPVIDADQFPKYNCSHTPYSDSHEKIPRKDTEARGVGFTMIGFVVSDYAGDHVTRRLRTGLLIKLNNSPIYWLWKK